MHLFICCVLSTSVMPGPGYTLWLEDLSLSLWGLHSMINKDTLLVYLPLTAWPIWEIWLLPFSWDPPLPSIQFSKWVSAPVHCPVSLLFCCLSLALGFLSVLPLHSNHSNWWSLTGSCPLADGPSWYQLISLPTVTCIATPSSNHYTFTTSLLHHIESILCQLPTWTTTNFCHWSWWFCRIGFGVRQSWVQILVATISCHMTLES